MFTFCNKSCQNSYIGVWLSLCSKMPADPTFIRADVWVNRPKEDVPAARHLIMATDRQFELLANSEIW